MQQAMREHSIAPIDLLVVNLYPFEATAAGGASFDECIENIDIGGPALIRAAAKNRCICHRGCRSRRLRQAWRGNGGRGRRDDTRVPQASGGQGLRAHRRLRRGDRRVVQRGNGRALPDRLGFAGVRKQTLRYGENPHQSAAFYISGDRRPGVASARQVQGKELSFNNLNDTDAAFELVANSSRRRWPSSSTPIPVASPLPTASSRLTPRRCRAIR